MASEGPGGEWPRTHASTPAPPPGPVATDRVALLDPPPLPSLLPFRTSRFQSSKANVKYILYVFLTPPNI